MLLPIGEHKNCKDNWCRYLKDSKGYKHSSLPHGKDLKGDELRKSLTSLFAGYASNAENQTSFAPKARHYSGSESFDFRVNVAVCKKNLGQEYRAVATGGQGANAPPPQ